MRDRPRLLLAALLVLGLLVRLPFAGIDMHLSNDITVFTQWARLVELRGLSAVYQGTGINYPPLPLYLLGGAALLDTHVLHGGDSSSSRSSSCRASSAMSPPPGCWPGRSGGAGRATA